MTLTSPNERDPTDAGSYIYFAGGKKIDDIDPQTIVAYEKTDLHEGEGTNVLYVDGHVEWMMMPQFDEALEQSKKNLKLEEPDTAGERDKSDSTDDAKSAKPLPEEHSTPPADAAEEKEKADLVRRLVAKGGPIATAIETYRAHVGQYPSRLEDLSNEPEKESLAEKWQGPYIKDTAMLEDLWGRPLKYLHPGEINAKSYDLWSVGSDGKSGTEDDIGNFKGSR